MRPKIFKYKFVGISIFIFELFVTMLFGYGSYDSFIEFSSVNIFSIENFIFIFALMIFITAILCLITIIFRIKKSIYCLNVNLFLILLFFLVGYIKLLINDDFRSDDNLKLMITISVTLVFIFLTNFFKYKEIEFLEIDNIGTHND
ncbi:hypothetical protein [Chryseobacterium sp. C3]|uniref:hypothetical protein n=1 Tax=Chryseobacterium sp. C3 TaxID=2761532 RepID=UPI0016254CED|nr:hypothetical protein [Chryseobacterium sp. C3]